MQALPLFFSGLSSLGALGSNTASLLGAQEYRFSFMCPKILLFISGLSRLGAVLLAQVCRNYVDSQRCLRQVEQLRCCDDNDILSKTM